ncbi:putative Leucine Rich repeat [Trypanosoma vivax]|uniref:Leucine-rich repeat protein n=1 Tax=Trypanosoma vivax (strain Y486) TaxID=1055687 RepID=F9WMT3_TRYVY|nr:putative Leucine Rich repeat [Trypanosoma vivax]CCD18846.1 leucine-rich repeat protein [Trypanosoma vivax Y486]|eukprot:CCD18846.1 leucine-rich repeat protein [Trypanosoma vivax Y486]
MAGRGAKRARRCVEKYAAPFRGTTRRSTRAETEAVQQSHVAVTRLDDAHVNDSARALMREHDVLCSRAALVERKIEQLKRLDVEQRGGSRSRSLYKPIYLQSNCISYVLFASISPTTTELTLVKVILFQQDLRARGMCVGLRKLSIVGCSCSSDLAPLFALTSLEELSLARTRPVVDVDGIHELPRLRVLDLSETAAGIACMRALSRCKSLVSLFLRSCMCDADCSDLVKIRTLEELDMSDSRLQVDVCAFLCLPHLRVLHGPKECSCAHSVPAEVSCMKLRTYSSQHCYSLLTVELLKMVKLEEVSFSHCGLKTRDVVDLAGLQRLRILSIWGAAIDDSALLALGKCAFLEKLSLYSTGNLTDVSPLADVLTLEELNLSFCSSIEKGAGDLGRLPHLRVLNLKHTRVTDSCVVGLGTSRSLVKLDLSWCTNITDITPVLGIATLEELNVLCCGEASSEKYDFSRLQSLRGLSLIKKFFEHEEHVSVFPSGLTKLNLYCADTSNITLSFIKKMQTLVELELIGGKPCINFDELPELPHLHTFSLLCCQFPHGVKPLSKCTTLVNLTLAWCHYPTDLLPLADMKSLEELHISFFKLSPGGVIGIPPLLRHLEVSNCNVTSESFKIPEYNVIECLDISSCSYLTNLSFIRKMKWLEKLLLDNDRNIEYCFEALSELPFLRYISTRGVMSHRVYST